jgi:hypothetical protein
MGKLLAAAGGEILEIDTDTGAVTVLVPGLERVPDGLVEDPKTGRVYWTDSGPGAIERVEADGGGRTSIVPVGGGHTPAQPAADWIEGKLYWTDRDGIRVMCCDLDGENVETLLDGTGAGADPALRRCAGLAVDHGRGQLYWTQRGGRILRATATPAADPAGRADLEILWSGLPEPIGTALDLDHELIYWTGRDTLNRAPLPEFRTPGGPPELLADGVRAATGPAPSADGELAYVGDLDGTIYEVDVTARTKRPLLRAGAPLTGLAIRGYGG